MTITISDVQLQAAMAFHEARAGQIDGLTICKEVSRLADVLGVMWFYKVTTFDLAQDSEVATLMRQAGILLK